MPDIRTALQTALQKAQTQVPTQPQDITVPDEWDDELTSAQTNQPKPQENAMQATQTTHAAPSPAPMSALKAQYFKPTTNVTRATFDHIKANPGLTRAQVIKQLEPQGYQMTSTSSIIAQFIRMGYVRRTDDGALFALINEYKPVKTAVLKKSRAKEAKQLKALVNAAKKQVHLTNGEPPKPTTPRTQRKVAAPVAAEPETKVAVQAPTNTFDAQKFVDSMTLGQARQVYDVLRKVFGG